MANGSEKARTTRRYFFDEKGEKAPRAHLEAVGFGIEVLGKDGRVIGKVENRLSDYVEGVVNSAALFGFVTSITNAAGGLVDDGDRWEAIESRNQALLEGRWSAEREVGMRTADLVEAAARLAKDKGVDLDREAYRSKLLSGEVEVSRLMANKRFAATVAAIQAERKQQRAAELAAKVTDEDTDALDDLLG